MEVQKKTTEQLEDLSNLGPAGDFQYTVCVREIRKKDDFPGTMSSEGTA